MRRNTASPAHFEASGPAIRRSHSSRGPLTASSPTTVDHPPLSARVSDYYRQAFHHNSNLKRHIKKLTNTSYENHSNSSGDDLPLDYQPQQQPQQLASPLSATPPSINRYSSPRNFLLALFTDEPSQYPDRLLPNMNIDLQIDEQAHTALHWAAAMGKVQLVKYLVSQGAQVGARNSAGETAFMRASFLPASYESNGFEHLVPLLVDSIACQDSKCKTILHHITLLCGSSRRGGMAKYYFECIVKYFLHNPPSLTVSYIPHSDEQSVHHQQQQHFLKKFNNDRIMFRKMLDWKDKNGDTALNIASRARIPLVATTLLKLGASKWIQNNGGLSPVDFGVNECEDSGSFSNWIDVPPSQNELEATFGKSSIFSDEDIQWDVPSTLSQSDESANVGNHDAFNFADSIPYKNQVLLHLVKALRGQCIG